MNKEKLEKIGTDWKRLNDIYDAEIQALINSAVPITSGKSEELKKMQQGLYDLEVELFELLQE
jgi:hypothetical protein